MMLMDNAQCKSPTRSKPPSLKWGPSRRAETFACHLLIAAFQSSSALPVKLCKTNPYLLQGRSSTSVPIRYAYAKIPRVMQCICMHVAVCGRRHEDARSTTADLPSGANHDLFISRTLGAVIEMLSLESPQHRLCISI
jgi:hypothetical protein